MPTRHYYELPHVGNFSRIMQKKITKLLKRYCKPDLDIKLVFTTFKLRNVFGVKDFVPQSLRSPVVYKFQCASCNACYIGENTLHLSTHIREHLVSDKSSHIYKHLQESETCKNSCSAESFTILDYGTFKFQIKIKEALYIKWGNHNTFNFIFSIILLPRATGTLLDIQFFFNACFCNVNLTYFVAHSYCNELFKFNSNSKPKSVTSN